MEWSALGATAIGAVLALSGTVVADLMRGRRERVVDDKQQRRSAYVDYLVVLSAVHGRLRALTRTDLTGNDLKKASRDEYGSNLFECRERLLLTASPSVIAASEETLRKLREIRVAIGDGHSLRSAEYHHALHEFSDSIWRLRTAFRDDLGGAVFTHKDLTDDWSGRSNCPRCSPMT